jgi:hypothetical protein
MNVRFMHVYIYIYIYIYTHTQIVPVSCARAIFSDLPTKAMPGCCVLILSFIDTTLPCSVYSAAYVCMDVCLCVCLCIMICLLLPDSMFSDVYVCMDVCVCVCVCMYASDDSILDICCFPSIGVFSCVRMHVCM